MDIPTNSATPLLKIEGFFIVAKKYLYDNMVFMDISFLNPLKLFATEQLVTGFLTGTIGYWVADKLIIKPLISKNHPEKLCLAFEKQVNIACNWILRRAESFNSFLENYKKKFPESGKVIEDSIIESMGRISKTVNSTTEKVIDIIKK